MTGASNALHPRLAEVDAEARGRALAKACRVLARMRSADSLRGHTRDADDEGDNALLLRRIVVQQAWNDDSGALRAIAASLADAPDGARLLIRALNNLRRVETRAASGVALVLLEALRPLVDGASFAKSLARAVGAVRRDTSFTGRVLELASSHAQAAWADPRDARTWVVQELVAADLRLDADSDAIIRKRGPLRPVRIRGATRERLETAIEDESAHWSTRLAAVWLLGAADGAGHELAMAACERAFQNWPLESMAAIDQIQIAVEYEASQRVSELKLADELRALRATLSGRLTELDRGSLGEAVASAGDLEAIEAAVVDDTAPFAVRVAAGALVDRRIRLDLVENFAERGELEGFAAWLLAREDHAQEPFVDLSAAVLGGLARASQDRFGNSLLVWERGVATLDTVTVDAAARQVVDAVG